MKKLYWNINANCLLLVDTEKPKKASERLQLFNDQMMYFYNQGWHPGTANGVLAYTNEDYLILIDEWEGI